MTCLRVSSPPRLSGRRAWRPSNPASTTAPDQTDYTIVNTGIDEFDYPAGERNATYRYTADGGIPVGGLMSRLAWAIRLSSSEMLFSKYLNPDSRLMVNRSIQKRASKVAPWLTFDPPYPTIVDGRVVWIMDGYTPKRPLPVLAAAGRRHQLHA